MAQQRPGEADREMDCRRAPVRNPDEWLEIAPEFSRPICEQVRDWILRWEPDLTESIKWNAICFSGRKLVCGVDACKRHASITFFRGGDLPDPAGLLNHGLDNATIRSIRIRSLDAIDPAALRRLLHAAVKLDSEPELPAPPRVKRPPPEIPEFLATALKQNKNAAAFFRQLAPTYQREYIVWLTTAKRDETRDRRLKETIAALAGGWKWLERRIK